MNKLPSLIGFLLLIGIIGFTVYINFFAQEPIEKEAIKSHEAVEIEQPQYRVLDSTDLAALWKLKNLQTDSIRLSIDKTRTNIQINELRASSDYILLKESGVYDELNDSVKELIQKNYFEETKMGYYGTLSFKNSQDKKQENIFEDFYMKDTRIIPVKSLKLRDVGNMFLEYGIKSIQTKPQIGDFTIIYLRDGREIFLIKENITINGDYYKERLESAEYLNDSTRVVLPIL
ncbi:hypothetical protein WAF17_21575 [Bernardetia sp. ABR2-2B]|uniref:hypothetical protein n=1 Tax=Bernardetia sp. ABR2-2B TaxID=3127472 RepID=UPI0030CDE50A